MRRDSIVKQGLTKTKKLEVLLQDLKFLLHILNEAIKHANSSDEYLQLMVTVTRFGQKQDHCLYLGFLNREFVKGLSVHMACRITAKDKNLHLLWSRHGLDHMVGFTTRQFTALGMHEAANAQTPLECPTLDLKHPLLTVLHQAPLRFVQLYADSPHNSHHPVSGSVALCGLQHPQSQASVNKAAGEYIDHVQDCCTKMVGQLSLRLEAVSYLGDFWPVPLRAEDFFDQVALEALLETYPVVLPVMDVEDRNSKGLPGLHSLWADRYLFGVSRQGRL